MSEAGGAASERSNEGSGNASETSSQRSDNKYLKKRGEAAQGENENETDLLEQRRNIMEGVFACMYTLARQTALSSWKWAVTKVALEFMMNFIVAFNPTFVWRISTGSLIWKVLRWILWREPIVNTYGYKAYVTIMYVTAAAVLLCVAALIWLTLAMRKQERSKWLRTSALALHVVYDFMFVMCYVSFFDYLTFIADCDFGGTNKHIHFGVECLKMPHLLHMVISLATAVIFMCVTALMLVASCDLDPLSRGYLASPAAYARLKILAAKAAYVVLANCLDSNAKAQAAGMLLCTSLIVFWNLRAMPFYRRATNVVWTGLWCGIYLPCVILVIMLFGKNHSDAFYAKMTNNVLYGIGPVVLGSMGVVWLYNWGSMLPARKFKDLQPGIKLARIHKFESVHEVERLARVMRVFDVDGLVDQEAAVYGEVIIKAGMQTFPNSTHLLILYSNFVLEARRDGPASRTQLQLAGKATPNLVERYQIFCTNEASKRLKDSAEGGMDLQAYIEFKRNFRAVLRVHKEALLQQTELWQLCMRSSVKVAQVDAAMEALEAASARAHQVYKRVLERYPTNGKLLRCYGKFLEDCRHDQLAAARAYGEANRNGGSGNSGLLALDLSGGAAGKPEFLTSMSMEDDAVVVADSEGKILMTSQAVQTMFGYAKTELEGANVSVLMPQPFSQRHPGYMARYAAGGEPHILDSVRQVVALHKERYVFPVAACVTKLSGAGSDSVFLGIFRPLAPNLTSQRAWISPNGVFLCADQHFASSVGIMEGELVGHTLSSLVADPEDVERLLQRCREAPADVLESGSIHTELLLLHRYLDPVPVDVTVRMAGSDAQRILVLHCVRTDGHDGGMMAVDSHMRIRFASCEVALLTGYTLRHLAAMKLDQLLPQPYNSLHAKWLRDPPRVAPPGSCRAGAAVHLLSEAGIQVPVKIHVKTIDADSVRQVGTGAAGVLHVVQVTKLNPNELFNDKRLVVVADFSGKVLEVSPPGSTVFDFAAGSLLGTCLSDFIDLFDDWRQRSGDGQMQLLLLALLDKEAEMPGTSWRVKVHRPSSLQESLPLPGQTTTPRTAAIGRTACLQVDLIEGSGGDSGGEGHADGDGGSTASRVMVTLWRRDLLSGVVELDEELTLRKASPLTALITGLPVTAMLRKPLGRFVGLPPAATTWEALVSACSAPSKKSALKASNERGSISPIMAFIGPHPDTGTMRLMVQGVQTLGPTGRAKVTLTIHPDATFVGAHADLMRVLKLDGAEAGHDSHTDDPAPHQQQEGAGASDLAHGGSRPKHSESAKLRGRSGHSLAAAQSALGSRAAAQLEQPGAPSPPSVQGEEGVAEGEAAQAPRDELAPAPLSRSLHRQATSRSEFVEQWVKALTQQLNPSKRQLNPSQRPISPVPEGGAPEAAEAQPAGAAEAPPGPGAAGDDPLDGIAVAAAVSGGATKPGPGASTAPGKGLHDRGVSSVKPWSSRQPSRDVASPEAAVKPKGHGHGKGHTGAGAAADEDDGNKSDRTSENGDSSVGEGSQAASAITSATDATSATDLVVDARRGRLLKALDRLLMGPSFMAHVNRLHVHSCALIAVMFLAHLVSYIVITSEINKQHDNVYEVLGQAMAMDRSQLIVVRSIVGAFCERPDVTAKVSVCASPLNVTVAKLHNAIQDMERFHQGVYLGLTSRVRRPAPGVYDVWTSKKFTYHFSMDTSPPQAVELHAGAWTMGNRFIAAAREAVWLLPAIQSQYMNHRTYKFIVGNGLDSLFSCYATSLDLLVNAAWSSVQRLRTELVVLLVVEAALLQLCCTLYELLLVRRLERARLLGMLAMLALPGPVLRQLVAGDQRKIVDDSDDEGDDNGSLADDGDDHGHGGPPAGNDSASAPAAKAQPAGASAAAPSNLGSGAVGWHPSVPEDGLSATDAAGEAEGGLQSGGPAGSGALVQEQERQAPNRVVRRLQPSNKAARGSFDLVATHGSSSLHVNGKVLLPSHSSLGKFMAPFFLWNLVVILIYAISIAKLNGMQEPLASLNMAAHVTFRYTRVRAFALAFVTESADAQTVLRGLLSTELDLFESEYNALMYGGLPSSLVNSTFHHAAPAGTFESSAFAHKFFTTKGCLRYNQSACFTPDSPYYEVTHNGLDPLVRRMISEMRLLTLDADQDVAYNGTRYTFMAAVAGNDLYEGLEQATQLFVDYSISRYNQVTQLHQILLIVSVFLVLGFFALLLWPHSRRMLRDASRQSGLLSLVPPELDVRGHVRTIFKRAGAFSRRV